MKTINYIAVECKYLNNSEKGVQIEQDSTDVTCWLPRSRVHGADDRLIDDMHFRQEITLRVEAWLVEREGLEGER